MTPPTKDIPDPKLKTLQELWREYRDACYPPNIPAEQNRECHQAFMSGALVALVQVAIASDCPDTDKDEAASARYIGSLIQEAEQWVKLRGIALNQPRN